MATSRKKTAKKTTAKRRPAAKKKTAAKRRPAAKKKTVKKTGDLKWAKGVNHPVTKRPCGGRVMSQRDKKLFTRVGKRRASTTLAMIREAYGLKKKPARKPAKKKTAARKPAAKKKTTAKRRPVAKKKTTARKPAKKKAAARNPAKKTATITKKVPRGFKEKKVSVGRAKFRYVIFDASGGDRYGANKLTDARRKLKELKKEHPKATLEIQEMRG